MKNKLMRITSVFIALTVLLCCLTACGKKEEEEPITKSSGEIEAPTTQELVDFDDYTLPSETEEESEDNSSNSSDETTTKKPVKEPNTVNQNQDEPTGGNQGGSDGLTKADMISLLRAAGYEYDSEQDIYYTTLNPWQRHFGFTDEYDEAASQLNMEYVTFKCDFTYGDKYWRIQCWKGQYALLSGAEMGVYTKDIDSDLSEEFYACASDDNLLEMGFDFYKTTRDYNDRNRLFYRPLEYHWWQTGFKFGYCNPTNCVAVMTLYAKDSKMADGIEKGLQNVTDKNGKLNPFYEYGSNLSRGKSNIYQRNGNQFKIIWLDAGYTNYTGSMV